MCLKSDHSKGLVAELAFCESVFVNIIDVPLVDLTGTHFPCQHVDSGIFGSEALCY